MFPLRRSSLNNAINRGLEQPDSPEAVMALILQGAPHDMTAAPSLFLNANPQTAQWKWLAPAFAGWSLISPSRLTLR